jgi:phenylpropionate dioxygenase-like ring-hydroxylating dioxygenase large terminal subunit
MGNLQQALGDNAIGQDWFVVCASTRVTPSPVRTMLCGQSIAVWRDGNEPMAAPELDLHQRYLAMDRYGYTWISQGVPQRPLFALPEYDQAGRRIVDCGAFGLRTSGLRVVENFLDMGHFPYVHTDILGKEPHTEVRKYRVSTDESDELWATGCEFWQPKAAAASLEGMDVDYTYRVMQPFSAAIYKTSPSRPAERDVIVLFVQPLSEAECRAHLLMLLYDDDHDDTALIAFQQSLFGQDKPILENQLPHLLPLDPRAEISVRADATSTAYRHWLRQRGVTYGAIKTV